MFKTKFLRPLQRDYNIEDGIARGKAANAEEEFLVCLLVIPIIGIQEIVSTFGIPQICC